MKKSSHKLKKVPLLLQILGLDSDKVIWLALWVLPQNKMEVCSFMYNSLSNVFLGNILDNHQSCSHLCMQVILASS